MNFKITIGFLFFVCLASANGEIWRIFNKPAVTLGRRQAGDFLLYDKVISRPAEEGKSLSRIFIAVDNKALITEVVIKPVDAENPALTILTWGGDGFWDILVKVVSKVSRSVNYRIQVYAIIKANYVPPPSPPPFQGLPGETTPEPVVTPSDEEIDATP